MPNLLIPNVGSLNAAVLPALSPNAIVESMQASGTSPLNLSWTGHPFLVGAAWMLSSAIFTTYSTTKFIKYPSSPHAAASLQQKNPIPLWNRVPLHRRLGPSFPVDAHPRKQLQLPPLSPSSRLTLYRFAGSLLFGLLLPLGGAGSLPQRWSETMIAIPQFLLPAVCLFVANFANAVALDRIGIGLTYTSKCGIPIITVLLTLLLDGASALPNIAALLSLLPIAVGIAAASWSAPTWETLGFGMAVLSTTAQSLLNVTSKRVLTRTGWSGPQGQRPMVAVGLLLTLAWNLWTTGMKARWGERAVPAASTRSSVPRGQPPLWLTAMAMISYHVEYLLSFIFVTMVGPITYGTCDAIRRLGIILFGRLFFGGDPLSKTNQMGIALALLGALCYSIFSTL